MALSCCASGGLLNQYIAAISACLCIVNSGSCYGWLTPIMSRLLGPDSEIPISADQAPWVISVIELGNLLSPLPAGLLANRVGRKPLILATGPLYILSWLIILNFPSALMMGVARVIQGLSMGLAFTATPVYLGEIASNATRGAITSIFFNSFWFGFLVEYAVGPFLTFTNFTRFTLALNIPFLLLFFWQPETPYHCVMTGNDEAALRSLRWFRGSSEEELIEELQEIKWSVEANIKSAKVRDLVATAEDRRAFSLLMVLTAVRLLSGTGAILVYATEIFDLTPNLSISPDLVTIALGAVMLTGGCLSSFTSDSVGRRPLLLISCVGSLLCQFCTGTYYFLLFHTSLEVSRYSWIAPVLILVYAGLCSAGMYPVCSAYTSELFSSNTRGIASSFSAINVTIFSFLMLVGYKPITNNFGLYANFYLYSFVTLCGSLWFYFLAPETKGKSFVQIRKDLCEMEVLNTDRN